ncbi:MAG: hypothetical protein WCW01_02025 [Gammaproteobacteria bacterium]
MIEPPKSKLNTTIKVLVSAGICAGLFYASNSHHPKQQPINNTKTKIDPALLKNSVTPPTSNTTLIAPKPTIPIPQAAHSTTSPSILAYISKTITESATSTKILIDKSISKITSQHPSPPQPQPVSTAKPATALPKPIVVTTIPIIIQKPVTAATTKQIITPVIQAKEAPKLVTTPVIQKSVNPTEKPHSTAITEALPSAKIAQTVTPNIFVDKNPPKGANNFTQPVLSETQINTSSTIPASKKLITQQKPDNQSGNTAVGVIAPGSVPTKQSVISFEQKVVSEKAITKISPTVAVPVKATPPNSATETAGARDISTTPIKIPADKVATPSPQKTISKVLPKKSVPTVSTRKVSKKTSAKHRSKARYTAYKTPKIYAVAIPRLTQAKFQPALHISGYTGNGTIGKAQIIMPILANTNRVFYGIFDGKISGRATDGWSFGGGLGYRRVVNDRIWGGYLLANYNATPAHNKFFVINPGLESLGQNWDFRLNAYIPTNTNHYLTASDWAGAAYNDYNYTTFGSDGHSHYDHKLRTYEATGPGADAEIGRAIPRTKLKLYLGGYYFKPHDLGSITGVSARVTYDINSHTAIEVRNTYDNVTHNTATIGIKLSFGGIKEADKTTLGIANRLLDPIENNLATSAKGYSTPVRTKNLDQGNYLYRDHIWFFTPPGTTVSAKKNGVVSGSGTYTDPYQGINQDTLDLISEDPNGQSYANLYFKTGTYDLSDGFIDNRMAFTGPDFDNYSLFGRTADYKSPPTDALRPELDGAMDFHDNTGITLSSLYLNKSDELGGDAIGIILDNASVTLNNTKVETKRPLEPGITGQTVSIAMYDGSTLNLDHDNYIYADKIYSEGSSKQCAGIYLEENSTLTIGNNNHILAVNDHAIGSANIAGIQSTTSSIVITGHDNDIEANMTAASANSTAETSAAVRLTGTSNFLMGSDAHNNLISGSYSSDYQPSDESKFTGMYGIFHGSGLSTITINGNYNTIQAETSAPNARVVALYEHNIAGSTGGQVSQIAINGYGNSFNVEASNNPSHTAATGILVVDTNLVIKQGNFINVNSAESPLYRGSGAHGILLMKSSLTNLSDVKMDVQGITITIGNKYLADNSRGIYFAGTNSAYSTIKDCLFNINSKGSTGISLDPTYKTDAEIARFKNSGNFFIIRPNSASTVA